MARKEKQKDAVIELKDRWLDLGALQYPKDVSASDVEAILIWKVVRINLAVSVPSELLVGDKAPDFKLDEWGTVKTLKKQVEAKVGESMRVIVEAHQKDEKGDTDAFGEAEKSLKTLNDFLKKSFQELRLVIRTAIAKKLGGKAKAEDLTSYGSVEFKEYRIKPGAFKNEVDEDDAELDLTKAFKRRVWQQCGLAWNGMDAVVSVRAKKEFKKSDLKELREQLGPNKATGAKVLACRFRPKNSATVFIEIQAKDSPPTEKVLIKAIKNQPGGRTVSLTFVTDDVDEDEDEDKKEKKKKKDGKEKGQEKGKEKG